VIAELPVSQSAAHSFAGGHESNAAVRTPRHGGDVDSAPAQHKEQHVRKAFLLAAVALVLLAPLSVNLPAQAAQSQAAPTRVATVSAQRVLNETTIGKAEMAKYAAAQQQRANDLRPLAQALEATRAELAKGGDPSTLAKLQLQEQQQRTALERATVQAQTDLQNMQRQLQTELLAQVRPIMEELAKARGFDIVLNADTSVAWASPTVDLTPAIIERMNQQK
jgi:Skp family chaperone for outer membrane proteins